jgi:beta-galactosidase
MKRRLISWAGAALALAVAHARQDTVLDGGWKFIPQDLAGAEAVAFDDAAWQSVTVPHCWNIEPGENGDSKHFDEGPGWYRLHIKPEAALAGKAFFLKFDAAYHSAEVFLNGQPVGQHIGGYGAFCFDVTPWLHPGADNLLAVKVHFKALCDSPPLGGDFTKFPGLYRNVHLLALDPLSVSPLDDAGPGVYLKQTRVDEAAAQVEITTKLRNANASAKRASVRCRLLDATGKELQTIAATQSVPASGVADAVQVLTIPQPHLWNGRLDPYLYQVAVEVSDGATVVDRVVQPLGLRYYRVDPAQGFFLNGQHYALHGVNRHQQRPGKGWAIARAELAEDVGLMCELGCTTVRTCHYQHADDYHALCDQAGLVVWAELAMVNGIHYDSPGFVNNTQQQLAELIKQNFNHPSICFWSLWNEIHIPKTNETEKLTQCLNFLRVLNAQAKQLDPTRLTTGASCCSAFAPMTITDVAAWNGYPGWYSGTPDGWPGLLAEVRMEINGGALAVSEYGAGASIHHHQLADVQPQPGGHFHPEEWQALVHEQHWKALRQAPYLWGTFVWVMFDFASLGRREGDHDGLNDKGLVTADRQTRKDAFYFYQAQWTTVPMVHINSRRFNPHPTGKTTVKLYTNCDSAELFLNGRTLGNRKANDCICLWPEVDLPAGENRLEARAANASDALTWNCTPDASPHLGPLDPPAKPKKKKK